MVSAVATDTIRAIENRLQERIGARRFQLWFKNSARLSVSNHDLRVEVPNNFICGWIENNFASELRHAAQETLGEVRSLRFEINPTLTPTDRAAGADRGTEARTARKAAGKPRPQFRYTLDKFVVGSSNQLAYSAIRSVVDAVVSQFNPLFLHGGCGLGKTHLLQGLCNALAERHPDVGWRYVSGEEFTNQFIVAVKTGQLDAFRRQYRHVDVLVIDDVHFLANKRATQEEFLHTYNAIDAAGKQVVMASDAHPRLIGQLQTSLVDRFISGMVVEITPPDLATRIDILQQRAAELGVRVARPVIEVLAGAVDGNVRQLEGAILKLVAYASLCNQPASAEMAQKVIAECTEARGPAPQISQIEKLVADFFRTSTADIRSAKRTRTVALARAVAMYLARKLTPMSFPEIGKYLGNKNHATVILACKKMEQSLALAQDVVWNVDDRVITRKLADVLDEIEASLGHPPAARTA